MYNRSFLFLLIFIVQACNINLYKQDNLFQHIKGEFINKTKYTAYKISFLENNKIIVYRNVPNRSDTCIGSWNIISKNKIVINCIGTSRYEDKLTNAFFPSFDICNDTIKVINRKNLKFDQMIFRRIK